jgi:hypothetical protein
MGKEVGAAIILNDSAQATTDDIIAYCRAHLADYDTKKKLVEKLI